MGEPADTSYRVQREDTLYSIAWRYGIDYQDLARWNGMSSDYRIHVGQVLVLKAPATAARAPPTASIPKSEPGAYRWPTEGQAAPRRVPGGGILIDGALGQEIRATRAGRVVYAGNGIRGYGNLIIIKHDDTYLSSYAHNRDLLVREGEQVRAGEVIAHMGEGMPHEPVLYFEIREYGRPIDPLPLLPTK